MEGLRFNLRRQLILVSILLLSLPWAGCQFIREMEGALREGQEQGLQATAEAVAAVIGARQELIYPDPSRIITRQDNRPSIYALPSEQFISVDGYADGWEDFPEYTLSNPDLASPLSLRYRALTRGKSLFLLIKVNDPEVIYHNPGLSREPNGDRLMLRTWQEGRRQEYVIATAAPGSVSARASGRRTRGIDPGRIQGYWQDAQGGYTLEIEIPLSYTGERLGFYVINTSASANAPVEILGNISAMETRAPPWLIYSSNALQTALAPFAHNSRKIEISDNQRWRVAELNPSSDDALDSDTFWLLRLIYRNVLAEADLPLPPEADIAGKMAGDSVAHALAGNTDKARYRAAGSNTRTLLTAAAPIRHQKRVIGSVVVSESGEQYLSLTDQAFSRLLGYSLLAIGLGALGLLGYASILSLRIRRLSTAASKVIDKDGSIRGQFPRSQTQDEIGELSRQYAALLDRLREYNDYLRTLSHKLSHELRTPIAIIQSSLENLEQQGQEQQVYIDRAQEGLARLRRILEAMSEASQLEESIRSNPQAPLDLVPLMQEVYSAYSAVYRDNPIVLAIKPASAKIVAAPELIIQALDKLMDNAASFSESGAEIALSLAANDEGYTLSVSNSGPTIPVSLENKLFDPMVSQRDSGDEDIHLGLGLHVVRLICEYHRGRVEASNNASPAGVTFGMWFPSAPK
jgi:two-component system, OmpR family, sensor histidine kinase ChvG